MVSNLFKNENYMKKLKLTLKNGILEGFCKEKNEGGTVSSVPRKKKHKGKKKKTLTCYSNFQMAFWEVPLKKKRKGNG